MDVIYPPTLDYYFMMQRPQHLMAQFARHDHRVYFCNQSQEAGRPPTLLQPNLYLVHDHTAFLRGVAPTLRSPLVWCSWGRLHETLDAYHPALVIFDCVDDFPQWRPYESAMLARADAVVVTADALLARLQARHPRVSLIPNGCDYPHFAGLPDPPPDLPSGPIAGFVGAWARWIDADLLERTASLLPGWQFVLVGPPFGGRTIARANVHHLGWRPYAELPAYLHRFDVALIPFIDDQVTRSAHPIKLWEYLAAGLPVVSTPVPEVAAYPSVVTLADTPAAFAAAIERAAGARSPMDAAVRQALARRHSWSERYRQIVAAVPEIEADREG